ncbi:MAG TPA: histidine kinase, partial [Solirubrobacteraceae bacterium]|nr:histidine kinase [Solirubrobacteraceae bacterium]
AAVAISLARSLDITYILMGTPSPPRGLRRLNDTLLNRLLRGLPGVDVRIVADRTLREPGESEDAPS